MATPTISTGSREVNRDLAAQGRTEAPLETPHGPPGDRPTSTGKGLRRLPRLWRSDLSVRQRLTLHSLVLMSVPLAIAVIFGLTTSVELSRLSKDDVLQRVSTALDNEVEANALRAATLATGLANTPAIAEAFATRDRETLATEILPIFGRLEQDLGVAQIHFHEPPAISFLRAHEPAEFGDDLSTFRATIVTANAERETITGLEGGRFGLGLRAVVPVTWNGEHAGTVEVGASFGADFFARFAEANDVEVAFYLLEAGNTQGPPTFTTYASTIGEGFPVGVDDLRTALSGEPTVLSITPADASLTARFEPVLDFSGSPIGVKMVAVSDDTTRAIIVRETTRYLLLAVVLLLGGAAASLLFARGLSRRLGKIREVLEHARDGDLSQRVELERRDEIGAIAGDVNETFDRLMSLMREVDDNAQTLAAAADEMSAVSEQLESNAGETAQRAVTATAAAKDVSGNVEAIAGASRQMSEAIGEIARSANIASNVVGRGVALTDETVAAMEALGRSSDEIQQVVTLISEIAGQTHLLALNANIEAARAGESGRAFAVVANEIGTLARRTATESEVIAERIREIGQETTTSIECMTAVSDTMNEINELQTAIASAVEEQSATTAEIGRSVDEAAVTTAAIADAVESVSDGTDETRQAAGNTASAAGELRSVADGLHHSIAYYTGR